MSKKESFWIPYADLMTVSMVIFLFIAVSYMALRDKEQQKKTAAIEEYKQTKESLYNELKETFKNDFQRWNLELDKDLSIKFTNPEVLFPSGKSEITEKFQEILKEFFPKYLSVIMQEKYKDKIAEIRIEGHTDDVPTHETNDPYIDNIKLSQDRSRKVLQYLRELPSYHTLTPEREKLLQFWLTANGLSFGRTLDANKQLTIFSNQLIDKEKSRRVEFRIVTRTDEVVQKVIEQLNK